MKSKTLLLLTATLLTLAGQLAADSSYYLWDTNTTKAFAGNVQVEPYKTNKAVEVLSFSFRSNREDDVPGTPNANPSGLANFEQVEILLEIDTTAIPKFLLFTADGSNLGELKLEGVTIAGAGQPKKFLTMSFLLVKFAEFNLEGVQGDRAVVAASFKFGAVQMETFKINPSDGSISADQTVQWSRVLNSASYSVDP